MMFNLMVALITLLFFVAFVTIYVTNREMRAAGWVAGTFFLGLMSQLIDHNKAVLEPYHLEMTGIPFLWGACICVVMACANRAGETPNFRLMGGVFATGLVAILAIDIIPVRATIMDWVGAAILICGCFVLYRHRKQFTSNLLFWFNVVSAATFALRPVILIGDITPGPWDNSQQFYNAVLYLSSSIYGVIGANIIFAALGSDLIERHQKEAMFDPLTGLLNRRGIARVFRELDQDIDNPDRAGRAILLFDIDHFKKVNDEFGHETGDTVLANIGATVRQLMQYHGQASRSGGEEFVFLFNAESSQAAFLVSEHLRVAISLLKHEGLPDDRRVTASFGLAFIRPEEPVKRLIRRADVALYAAKDAGRNRLRLAEGDNLPEADETMSLPNLQLEQG